MKIHFIPLFLVLISPLFANTKVDYEEPLTHKTEVKFLIPELKKIDPSILSALKTGKRHPEILRRGIVVQQYLAVTKKNIFRIFRELQFAGIPFGSDKQMSDFLFSGKAQEIRLIRKSIKEANAIRTIYQIGLQGNGELSADKIETPELLSKAQMQTMKVLFENLQTEVNYTIQKIYFECIALSQANVPIFGYNGSLRTIEIDIFLANINGKVVPLFNNGEIKFCENDQQQALIAAREFQQDLMQHPSFLGPDITHQPAFKARYIAVVGLPSHVKELFKKFFSSNARIVADIQKEYNRWADPNVLKLAFEPPKFKEQIAQRVLMNAEPFGFGPSAAIAEFFPYLRDRIRFLAYIGSGHTLNLQSKLPYDQIYDIGSIDQEKCRAYFSDIAQEYDVFITASDFEKALWAKQAGLKVIIYDPLTWYWPDLPNVISLIDFYIAQNFFGVAERLKCELEHVPESVIVPPIISGICSRKATNTLLVNMGGLSNPYLKDADLHAFSSVIFNTVYEVLKPQFEKVYFVTSQKIAKSLHGPYQAATMLPSEVQDILSQSRLAIMTSGLGNIYEASAMQKEILWLPPANDSQGQQIKLLQQHHMIDFAIDWHHVLEDEDPIDYFAPQQEVLKRIAICMQKLASDPNAQTKLKAIIEKVSISSSKKQPALSKLIKIFEIDGAKQASESILQWLSNQEMQKAS